MDREVHCYAIVGVQNCPIVYVICQDDMVTSTAPALLPSQPHSTTHGSIEDELINRLSRDHALFRMYNCVIFD